MNYVLFNTTTPLCQVAVATNDRLLTRQSDNPYQHGEQLLSFTDQLLKEQCLSIHQLDIIGITHGPGSFVGTRLGCAVAQSLGFALNKPVVTISTLQAIAQTAYTKTHYDRITVLQDARMGQFYMADYRLIDGEIMQEVGFRRLVSEEDDMLNSLEGKLIVGNVAERWHAKHRSPGVIVQNSEEIDMQVLLRLVQYLVERGEILTAAEIMADYGRNTS